MTTTNRSRWTQKEIDILCQHYAYMKTECLQELLPGRSVTSITNKAHSIGLRTCGRGNWTDKEIAILRENYASMRAKDIQKLLPGRNIESIHSKASQLGIHRQFQKQ